MNSFWPARYTDPQKTIHCIVRVDKGAYLMSTENNEILLRPDEGKVIQVLQERMIFKVMSADTNGLYTLFVSSAEPGGGSPPHIHHREDEAFFILEGNYEFQLGDKTLELGPGSFLFVPRGIPHSGRNVGTTMSSMLVIVSPAGLENFFIEMGQPVTGTSTPATPGGPADIEKLVTVTQKYGVELLAPPEHAG
jgi:quercetin dioxygenase-like cupin family protein